MKTHKKKHSSTKVITGGGRSRAKRSLLPQRSRLLIAAGALVFAGIGTYFIVRSFAATPKTYTVSSAPVTIGSWNMYVDNKTKMQSAVPKLMKTADVLGLQEVHTTAQRNSVKNKLICKKCAYDGVMYKNKNTKKQIDPRGGYPIIWKRDVFQRVDKLHIVKMAPKTEVTKKIKFKARYAAWTVLRDKRTGKEIIVINTHTYAKAEYEGKSRGYKKVDKGYAEQMKKLSTLIKSLQKSKNLPIFVVGDLNVDYRYDNGTVSYFPKATFTKLGFVSNWASANYPVNDSTVGTAPNEDLIVTTSDEAIGEDAADESLPEEILGTLRVGAGGRIIDYVYASQRNDVSFQQTSISQATYGSDHAPIFATYTIGTNTPSVISN